MAYDDNRLYPFELMNWAMTNETIGTLAGQLGLHVGWVFPLTLTHTSDFAAMT